MNGCTAGERLKEAERDSVKSRWLGTWDWPLVGILVLMLALLLILTMGFWLPNPYRHS